MSSFDSIFDSCFSSSLSSHMEDMFVPPEGPYTLSSSVHVPLPDAQQSADPELSYSSSVDIVTIRYPPHPKTKHSPVSSDAPLPDQIPPQQLQNQQQPAQHFPDSSSSTGDAASSENAPFTAPPAAPRRRPLVSFSSLPGLSSANSFHAQSRPRNTFRNSTSTFIKSTENIPPVNNTARARGWDNQDVTWAFWTTGRSITWAEPSPKSPCREFLSRINFTAHATSLSINKLSASHDRLDILVGFATGDILWLDPLTGRYTRFNKSGCVTNSSITSVVWYPGSEQNFISAHADGCMLLWDKDRDDPASFTPNPNSPFPTDKTLPQIIVTKPRLDKKGSRYNPVSHWKISTQAITALAFSPQSQMCAVTGEDGFLRIIDITEQRLLHVYESYYGAFTSVAWSPDARFVLAGGQDDLVTIFATIEGRVVARCPGHSSFVTHVSFDPWRCDAKMHRFASVGEDCKLILWDLSSACIQRPKSRHPYMRRASLGSSLSLVRRRTIESNANLPLSPQLQNEGPIFHPAPKKGEVNVLQPVTSKVISNEILVCVKFERDSIITFSRKGHLSKWTRPPDRVPRFFENDIKNTETNSNSIPDASDDGRQSSSLSHPQSSSLGSSNFNSNSHHLAPLTTVPTAASTASTSLPSSAPSSSPLRRGLGVSFWTSRVATNKV